MGFFLLCLGLVPFVICFAAVMSPKRPWGRRLLPGALTPALAPYRASTVIRWRDGKEPRVVRVTSTLTAFLGGMLFPGGFVGLVGIAAALMVLSKGKFTPHELFVMALAASVPTGMVIAFRCLRLFSPMVDNRAGVTTDMRSLASFSILQNVYVVLAYLTYALAVGEPTILALTLYNAVSFAHAWLLREAARVMDRENEANAEFERQLADAALSPVLAFQEIDGVDVLSMPPAAQSEQPIPTSSTSTPGVSTAMREPA